ncbi:MAG TPA: pyrroline-5-carboxylate reductase [Bacteroidales bacterium]|nr:pyrroline-5-carboxylate reductase [Bacteroidales bacterium]
MRIHIIGGGNLGVALAKGFALSAANHHITVTRRNIQHIAYLADLGIRLSRSNTDGISMADVVLLCVKPHQAAEVLVEIAPLIRKKVLLSAVTGFSTDEIKAISGDEVSIVRIMPNIAAQYGESATCVAANGTFDQTLSVVHDLLEEVGTVIPIEEKLMDAATVLGACGTAFALRYIRASMQAGIEIGFDAHTALSIASQTAKGAAMMALCEQAHPEQLIDRVTTPQGCTIVGLNEMEHQGFSSSLIRGIRTSLLKIK